MKAKPPKTVKLTVKQQLFVEAYLGVARGNATEACRQAGYKGNDRTLQVVGAQNLSKPIIAKQIELRLAEAKKCMGADEVLERLSDHARASLDDFLEGSSVNFEKARKAGKMHLLKSISPTKYGTRIEVVDAHAALVDLGRHHKLFVDKIEHSGTVDVTDKRKKAITRMLEKAMTTGISHDQAVKSLRKMGVDVDLVLQTD